MINKLNILLIGIGGAGINITNYFYNEKTDIKTVSINTDKLDLLLKSKADIKLLIGETFNNGNGAGGKPENGEKAAIVDETLIRETIKDADADLIFIVAGLGGGTGTGAYSIILEIAKELSILTFALYIMPFDFEGKYKRVTAQKTADKITEIADAYLYFENDKIFEINKKINNLAKCYAIFDDLIFYFVTSISRMLNNKKDNYKEFNKIISCFKNAGNLYFDYTKNITKENLTITILKMFKNPLADISIENAKSIIISIRVEYKLTEEEEREIIENIKYFIVNGKINILFNINVEEKCDNIVSIIIINNETTCSLTNNNIKEIINQDKYKELEQEFNKFKKKNKIIFLSYSHKDKLIADEIEYIVRKKLNNEYYISRDINEIKYKDSIRKYMESISDYNYVIMLISKSYLTSDNCMYEMLETMRNKDFRKRILTIILDEGNIYTEEALFEYQEYWNSECKKKEEEIKKFVDKNEYNIINYLDEKRKICEKIKIDIIEFIKILNDDKGEKYVDLLNQDFLPITDYIITRDKKVLSK